VVADLHVHLYPCYNLKAAIDNAFNNLSANAAEKNSVRAIALTERNDCNFFEQLKIGRYRLAEVQYEFEPTNEKAALEIISRSDERVILYAGRQIISAEKIEVLALTLADKIEDGLKIEDLLKRVNDAGAVAIINWAPGKWFFKRGSIVEKLIEKSTPGSILLGDTSLRPKVWKEPKLMALGKAKGLKVIKGSDPLPFAGEEAHIGCHGVNFKSKWDALHPVTSMRAALKNKDVTLVPFGESAELMPTLKRLKNNEFSRRKRSKPSTPNITSSETPSKQSASNLLS